jgi:mono/diheme cytochrome c family protein
MMRRVLSLALLTLLAATGSIVLAGGRRSAGTDPPVGGRALFVRRCASCHAADGRKPLPSGRPLAERDLKPDVVAGFVRSRLGGASPEAQQAVTAYILGFMTEARSASAGGH